MAGQCLLPAQARHGRDQPEAAQLQMALDLVHRAQAGIEPLAQHHAQAAHEGAGGEAEEREEDEPQRARLLGHGCLGDDAGISTDHGRLVGGLLEALEERLVLLADGCGLAFQLAQPDLGLPIHGRALLRLGQVRPQRALPAADHGGPVLELSHDPLQLGCDLLVHVRALGGEIAHPRMALAQARDELGLLPAQLGLLLAQVLEERRALGLAQAARARRPPSPGHARP